MPSSTATLQRYYANPAVQRRIREYCGDAGDGTPTAAYLAGINADGTWEHAGRYPVDQLEQLLLNGDDISRSLWDTSHLLVHLDIDYQNTDFPGEAYHHPADVFFKLEPVYRAVQHVLRRFQLPLFALMTGQGYHFTGRVPLDSAVVTAIGALVPEAPTWLQSLPARQPPWVRADVTSRHARAYVGAGMLMEFLAHQVWRRAARRSPIPIVVNGTVVGAGLVGRECVSLDLSAAGDPMDVRYIRVAFGAYQKHRFRPDRTGNRAASELPPLIAVPRRSNAPAPFVTQARTFQHAARAARSRSAMLPVVTNGVRALLDAYYPSALARFHRSFYAAPRRRVDECEALFRSVDLSALPTCVARPLSAPNDLLLQPACIQHVTRWLTAEGMPARDIASLVRARYAADFGWGGRWSWLDAETRAEFDVRVFAGLLATGLDGAIDFNCRSAQEKGLCPVSHCERDLRVDRARLLSRVAV